MRKLYVSLLTLFILCVLSRSEESKTAQNALPNSSNTKERVEAKKITEWSDEYINASLADQARFVIFFLNGNLEEGTELKTRLDIFATEISQEGYDLEIGFFNCEGRESFNCQDDSLELPRFIVQETKRIHRIPIGDLKNLDDAIELVRYFSYPRIFYPSDKTELEEIFEKEQYHVVAYLPGSDEKHSILLQNLATKGRAASPIFYTISRIQSAIGEFKEEGIYFVNKNAEEGDMVSKFGASLDDEITHLTDNLIMHFEAESLPLVLDFTSDVFGRVFTGSISTQLFYFVKDLNSDVANHARDLLREVSRHNRANDLQSQRIVFVIYKIGTTPYIETSFGDLKEGQIFISSVVDNMFLRFKYEEESFDIDTVINFIEKYRSKSLTQFYISEPDHEHDEYFNNTSILRVTGRQFRDKIVKNNQTYLVMLCDTEENCPDGLGALSLLDKLNPNPESLKFAYVDVSKNEIPGMVFDTTPHILLYIQPYKGKPRAYELQFSIPVLSGWINTYVPGMTFNIKGEHMFEHYYKRQILEYRVVLFYQVETSDYKMDNLDPEFLKNLFKEDEELQRYLEEHKNDPKNPPVDQQGEEEEVKLDSEKDNTDL